jgi:hypothetical protein
VADLGASSFLVSRVFPKLEGPKFYLFNNIYGQEMQKQKRIRKQIEIKSPVRSKDLEGRFHVLSKTLIGADGSRKEFFDTDKMVTLNSKKRQGNGRTPGIWLKDTSAS